MNKVEFVKAVGGVFEDSPWVAVKVWESLPFSSSAELLQAMATIVQQAEDARKLELLRAHPDLGTRLKMSGVSQKEQAEAGLDQLSKDEFHEFHLLNKQYVEKFGFPFIMAVKGQSKEKILSAMKQRVNNSYEDEYEMAFQEVNKIAKFRLDDIIQ